ncbi:serine beta-lactamase-like protein LACTB, mitochondrial [Homarus americanus]|uniref:serine beta-lactamase-like protein LACTB, mitochondrial n=1 Tax=Homarus americanus TaxID=6706 RepID=UPI001C45660F|nr:serine beta-lactamase-like protein LACTB, mitochondrial [Homarus americanus]
MLFGIVGTAAALGMGSALCKSQGEDIIDKDLPPNSPKASTKTSVSVEELLDSQEIHSVGRDVAGTEKYDPRTQESSEEDTANVQNSPKAFSTAAIIGSVQKEKLSDLQKTVRKSRQLLKRVMEEAGAPGLVISVSVDGKTVWADGFGFADLENHVRCSPDTVMRIASISKPLTMTAVAKLWEAGKLDLDAPIQKYIPSFPVKTYNGEEVRHKGRYKNKENVNKVSKKAIEEKDETNEKIQDEKAVAISAEEVKSEKEFSDNKQNGDEKNGNCISVTDRKRMELYKIIRAKANKRRKMIEKAEEENEFNMEEYYIKEEFDTIQEALELFQNDELFFKPGSGYHYTTHGWTVVSGVVEAASGKPFTEVITGLFYVLGMDNTYLDKNNPIIYNRSRNYVRDVHGKLMNAAYIDNSYKWAGGGFLSTVHDLSKFGNIMLYASQHNSDDGTQSVPGILKVSTMRDLWTPVKGTGPLGSGYGMGWGAAEDKYLCGFCRSSRRHASHSGGAVGASSCLLVLPKQDYSSKEHGTPPKGVVVAIITNMQGVRLKNEALQIAKLFENIQ